MLYCSYGNGFRLIGYTSYKSILLTGAKSLCTRFNPKTGCIKSWDEFKEFSFPVIIDNMMNLEFLFWATKITGDSSYYKIAITHANTTLKNHFRNDNSSYHVICYDTATGSVLAKKTAQGYADESAWARGQAWGLYGYTMCYRETKDTIYLNQANSIANFILTNKNLPLNMVPYWDFNLPDTINAKRDVSTASIVASALLELSEYITGDMKDIYIAAAEKMLLSLTLIYRAELGTNGNFILKHSVGSIPHKSEIDVPLTYADYYYIEALMRYIKIKPKLSDRR
jgi:unsaturated chondroitin disaccharide hydrolase